VNRRTVLPVCAVMTALATAGCGVETHTAGSEQTHTVSSGQTKTDTYTMVPTPVPVPRPQNPVEVAADVRALWRVPHATELDHVGRDTPRMRAARRLIGSFASDKVVPDKQAVEALLGKPDRGTADTTWRYLLSVRHPPDDACERDLEVEFRRDGALNGLTIYGEHCLSD
jgi:hypothetical protein